MSLCAVYDVANTQSVRLFCWLYLTLVFVPPVLASTPRCKMWSHIAAFKCILHKHTAALINNNAVLVSTAVGFLFSNSFVYFQSQREGTSVWWRCTIIHCLSGLCWKPYDENYWLFIRIVWKMFPISSSVSLAKLSRHQNIRGMRSARVHVREYKLNIDDSAPQVKTQQAAGF